MNFIFALQKREFDTISLMSIKKIVLMTAMLSALSAKTWAGPFNEFSSQIQAQALKPFALDIGGVLGGAEFDPTPPDGFPGFSLGLVGVVQSHPDTNDVVLKNSGVKGFGVPMVQGTLGLPFHLDVVAHGFSYDGATVLGGGLRYGLFTPSRLLLFLPTVEVSAMGDMINDSAFTMTHLSGDISAIWRLPIIQPFIGAGFDDTKATIDSAQVPGLTGLSATATGSRLAAGIDITPFPFVDLRAAYMLFHGIPGGSITIGVGF